GRWLIENAHPDSNHYIFPELHPFFFNRIEALEDPKTSDVAEETVSVAAPIYERVTDDGTICAHSLRYIGFSRSRHGGCDHSRPSCETAVFAGQQLGCVQ